MDFSQLHKFHQLILTVYGIIEVNIEDLVEFLNSKPLPNNQSRELRLVIGDRTNMDTEKLVDSLVEKFMSASTCYPCAFLFRMSEQDIKLPSVFNHVTKEKLEMHIVNRSIFNLTKPPSIRILTRAAISDHDMALRRDGPSRNNFWTVAKLDRLSEDKDSLISFLYDHGIASKNRICKKCGKDNMRFEERANGNVRYLCGKRILPGGEKCSGKQGFLVDTFMSQTKLPLVVILKYILLWTKGLEQQKIAEEVGISTHSVAPWNHYCRKAAYWAVQKRATPIGGNGDVVEIDESKFGKRKYNRGHRVDGSWVFGGISRNSGDVFMVQVEKRDKTTLLPLIRQWILPQTTIICDGWRAYNTLEEEDYEVLRVIHKKTFKTPASQVPAHIPDRIRNAVHTNAIEATWGAAKRMVFRAPGNHNRTHLPGDLAKYLFVKHCRVKEIDPFLQMLKDCQDAYASGDDLDYSILDGHCESETSDSEEELSNAFQPPEIERDVAEPEVQGDVTKTSDSEEELSNAFQPPEVKRDIAEPGVQGDVAVQIEGLPSGLVVGSDVMVPWPLSGKKKICAAVVEMSAEEITVQFGTGKRFPYLRYLWNKINVFLPE